MDSTERGHERRDRRRSYSPGKSRRSPRRERVRDGPDGESTKRRRSRDAKDDQGRQRHHDRHRSHRHTRRSRSASPRRQVERERGSESVERKPLPSQEESYRGHDDTPSDALERPVEKQKPNFKPSGLLAAETNKVSIGSSKGSQQSIVLKYHEPPEARKAPATERWIMYVFKGSSQEPLETIPLHARSCWLLGREAAVADILTEHPSCSKQQAVFQFRHTVKKDEWGEKKDKVGLYILDLESANGTFLNGDRIDAARYVQCISGDVVKFGDSSREYVILLPPKE